MSPWNCASGDLQVTGKAEQSERYSGAATGDCFKAAFEYLIGLTRDAAGHKLAHGFITRNSYHSTIVHAWVEREIDDHVIDKSNQKVLDMSRAAYYERYGVRDVKRYSLKDATWKQLKSRHYGPWEHAFEKSGER